MRSHSSQDTYRGKISLYTLFIATDTYHAKQFKIIAPSAYPQDSIIRAGELRFDEGIAFPTKEGLVRFLRYDAENRDYYKGLFEKLAASSLRASLSGMGKCERK